jgi:hypothetical protein
MVNETAFQDNASQWEAWQKDKGGYGTWLKDIISNRPTRSHGFSHVTQYKQELAEMRKTETVGQVEIINEEPGAGPG